MITQNRGRDITKYFYGSYNLERDVTPHVHTNIARRIVNELAIARIFDHAPQFTMSVNASQVITDNTKTFILRPNGSGHVKL